MSFFYTTVAGFYDFVILAIVCGLGLLSVHSRTMALASIVAFLIARTFMAVLPEIYVPLAIVLAYGVLFYKCISAAKNLPQKVYSVLFIPIMAVHAAVTLGYLTWSEMTTYWVLAVAAQLLIIAGGASYGGMAAMVKWTGLASFFAGAGRHINRNSDIS